MTKELQDLAWSVLPKEFKEEVKRLYREFAFTREGYYKELFGRCNLTSDAEGEEMLYAKRSDVIKEFDKLHKCSYQVADLQLGLNAFRNLFGSKCLPDKTMDKTMDETKEPKPAELEEESRNLSKNIENFDKSNCNRLNIAAMAMQGILSNAERMKQYGEIAMRESDNLTQLVARNALRYADALIAEAQKGGVD